MSIAFDRDDIDLKAFIVQTIERTGGVVDEVGPDLVAALLPPEIAANAASDSVLTLALSQRGAENQRDASLAAIGTPIMDSLIGFAGGIGTTSICAIHVDNIRKKGLKEEAERILTYSHCRLRTDAGESVAIRDSYYAVFRFRMAFVSYEKREKMETIVVSLDTIAVNHAAVSALNTIPSEPLHISVDMPPFDSACVKAAYEVAKKEASRRAQSDGAEYLSSISRRFQLEANRLAEYYDQTDRELRRRLDKEAEEKKREAILSKQQAVKLEKARKLAELGEKYRLRPRAALASIQIVRQPKSFFNIFVDKGKQTRKVTLIYDSLLCRLEPPICDRCGCEMTRIFVTSSNEHLCLCCSGSKAVSGSESKSLPSPEG